MRIAIVLTACGIETGGNGDGLYVISELQQCLPLAVLKRAQLRRACSTSFNIAIVLTACGIETGTKNIGSYVSKIAIVLTACGIETNKTNKNSLTSFRTLQQCLPLAVLKRIKKAYGYSTSDVIAIVLTACGIETDCGNFDHPCCLLYIAIVLTACGIETPKKPWLCVYDIDKIAIVLTACGIETNCINDNLEYHVADCNSAYRLRY